MVIGEIETRIESEAEFRIESRVEKFAIKDGS